MSNNDYEHEFQRIRQFVTQAAGNEDKLRQLLLTRAGRCSNEKRVRFVNALREFGLDTIASFIDSLMVNR